MVTTKTDRCYGGVRHSITAVRGQTAARGPHEVLQFIFWPVDLYYLKTNSNVC